MYFFYFVYYVLMTPIGWVFLIVFLFLLGACVMGMVDFKKKKKPLAPKLEQHEQEETLQAVQEYLDAELDGEFEVQYFDDAYQVFTTPDLATTDETLFGKLRLRFPQSVFVLHRTLYSNQA